MVNPPVWRFGDVYGRSLQCQIAVVYKVKQAMLL